MSSLLKGVRSMGCSSLECLCFPRNTEKMCSSFLCITELQIVALEVYLYTTMRYINQRFTCVLIYVLVLLLFCSCSILLLMCRRLFTMACISMFSAVSR